MNLLMVASVMALMMVKDGLERSRPRHLRPVISNRLRTVIPCRLPAVFIRQQAVRRFQTVIVPPKPCLGGGRCT